MKKFIPQQLNWADIVVRTCAVVIFGSCALIMLISFFVRHELDLGWIFVLSGSSFLSFDAIEDLVTNWKAPQSRNFTVEASLLAWGLAFVSKSQILSSYFYGTGLLCGIFVVVAAFSRKKKRVQSANSAIVNDCQEAIIELL